MSSIKFFTEDIDFKLPHPRKTSSWIKSTIQKEKKKLADGLEIAKKLHNPKGGNCSCHCDKKKDSCHDNPFSRSKKKLIMGEY